MVTVTNPMTSTVEFNDGTAMTVTTSLDAATGAYTTTAVYPEWNITVTGTPQQVIDQLNSYLNKIAYNYDGSVDPRDKAAVEGFDIATNTILDQQHYIGALVNSPNIDPATPPAQPTTTDASSGTTTTTTTTQTGGGSVTKSVNPDGTVTTTVVPDQNSTVTTTTTQEANPQINPQPAPAVNTPTQTVAPGLQTTQNNTTPLTSNADADRNPQNSPAQNQQSPTIANNTGSNPSASPSDATSTASSSGGPQAQSPSGGEGGQGAPGRRTFNPLSSLASYNYILSLYTMSPSAHDAWVAAGRKNPAALTGIAASGIYLLCQSGGINNSATQRAPGFNFDYYIDNLKCTSLITAKASGGDYFNINFSFNIIEPYGFSFLKNLRDAQSVLYQSPEAAAAGSPPALGPQTSPLRGMYILGIQFVGWNLDGSQADLESYNQFYDIQITGCTFKLDGKPVVYNITAVPLGTSAGLGTKRGTLDSQMSIQGGTVDGALNGPTGIITKMNEVEANLYKNGKVEKVNKYTLEYIGPDVDLIKNASIVSPADVDKIKWPGAKVDKPSDSNEATAQKSPPNNTERTITIAAGTNISDATGQIIKQSTYLTSALNKVYTTSLEPDQQGSPPSQTNDNSNKLSWYNLSVQTTNARWDNKRGDWVYDIKYVITTYDTPSVQTPYANNTGAYLGPYKRYDYWYTGKNTEVQSIAIDFDTSYFLATLDTGDTPNTNAPYAPGKQPNENTTGKTTSPASAAQNSYMSYLYDPAAYQNVVMKILGDPDYLVTLEPPAATASEVYNKFYGPGGFKINPNTGQFFIEVNFLEAVDYDNATGVLNLNDQIFFGLGSPKLGVKPQGIVFQVIQVDNDFVGGKFTQAVTMNGTPWPNISNSPNPAAVRGSGQKTASGTSSGPTSGNNNATANSTGLTKAQVVPDAYTQITNYAKSLNLSPAAQQSISQLTPGGSLNTTPTRTSPTGSNGAAVADADAAPPTTNATPTSAGQAPVRTG